MLYQPHQYSAARISATYYVSVSQKQVPSPRKRPSSQCCCSFWET